MDDMGVRYSSAMAVSFPVDAYGFVKMGFWYVDCLVKISC